MPDAASIRYCRVAPAAAPAGTTRLNALAASCDVEIANQSLARNASERSSQTHAKLAASASTAAPSHNGSRCARRGHAENTSPRLGMNRYRTTSAATSASARRMIRPRRGAAASGKGALTPPDASERRAPTATR